MISYFHTGKKEYLDTAKKVAHYCIANIPESGIIPVDFRQPKEPAWEDSCGAVVIAGGLLEISNCVPELEKDLYRSTAVKILKAIDERRADWNFVMVRKAELISGGCRITNTFSTFFRIEFMALVERETIEYNSKNLMCTLCTLSHSGNLNSLPGIVFLFHPD